MLKISARCGIKRVYGGGSATEERWRRSSAVGYQNTPRHQSCPALLKSFKSLNCLRSCFLPLPAKMFISRKTKTNRDEKELLTSRPALSFRSSNIQSWAELFS